MIGRKASNRAVCMLTCGGHDYEDLSIQPGVEPLQDAKSSRRGKDKEIIGREVG